MEDPLYECESTIIINIIQLILVAILIRKKDSNISL